MNRDDALEIQHEYVKNVNLRRHMYAVAAAMEDYAEQFNEDSNSWVVVGILHDFDYEIHPTLDEHPQDGAPILRERGVPEDIIQTILSHAEHTGVPRKTLRDKALYACDEITGLITAVALVRPSKSINDVQLNSVRKKWKDERFAAGVKRTDVENGAQDLGIELWLHIENVLHSMQRIAVDLGLDGSNSEGAEKA